MKFTIAVLPGDGVGPDVVNEGIRALEAVGRRFNHQFVFEEGLAGGISIDKHGSALTPDTLALCRKSDAVLLGAVGGPKWDDPLAKVRPEDGLLALRKELKLFANLRPVRMYPVLENSTTLKPEVVSGVDMLVIRELTGGLYFGKPKKRWLTKGGRKAVDSMIYSEKEIERIVRVGFELAMARRKKLTSVDKANVLESSRLWRQVANEVANDYPHVKFDHMLVDACSMKLIRDPRYFDVIVTENTFGDILTDEASMLAGSMGMLPSASLAGIPGHGKKAFGLYEPIHGSAPDIAGKNVANPIATVLSTALMLRYSFSLRREAEAVENAVHQVLNDEYRTHDIMSEGMKPAGTMEMGRLIADRI